MTASEIKEHLILRHSYLKDLSFETPLGANVFLLDWEPDLKSMLALQADPLTLDTWEVVVTVTLSARIKASTVLLVEAQQAGVFSTRNLADETLRTALVEYAPAMIFPDVSKTISTLIEDGGFPRINVAPVDFHQMTYPSKINLSQDEDPASATDS